MTYRLKGSWALRGWSNAPFCAIDMAGEHENPVRPMPFALFSALVKCDGARGLPQDRRIDALARQGIIESGTAPISPWQRYRVYPFERRRYAQIGITSRCNYRCRHCFMAGGKDGAGSVSEFTDEQCARILDELLKCGITAADLTGGEPLSSKNFFIFAEGMARRHMRMKQLLTNGALLTDEILSRLTSTGHTPIVTISFDGLTAHDWMRGEEGAGRRAIEAMRLVREHGLPLRCAINVNRRTLTELEDTCRFLRDEGAQSLYLIPTSVTPRWQGTSNEETLPHEIFFEKATQIAREALAADWGMGLDVFNGFHLTRDGELVEPMDFGADLSEPAMSCHKGRRSLFIAHDGRVLPCDAFEGITLAGDIMQDDNNILKRPLEDILTSSSYSRAYDMPLSRIVRNNAECAACEHLLTCRGGCRAYAYGTSMAFHEGYKKGGGRLDYHAQTYCVYYKGGFDEKIRAIVKEA